MAHRNTNKRERQKARALAERLGVSYQESLRRLRSAPDERDSFQRSLQQSAGAIAVAEARLEPGDIAELRRRVEALIAQEIDMEEFTPIDLVDSHLEVTNLVDADLPDMIEYIDAELVDDQRFSIVAELGGSGTVEWHVTTASAFDVEAYGDQLGPDNDGPGVIQEWETDVPVRVLVWATFDTSTRHWGEIEVQSAGIPREEIERRHKRHRDQEFEREQRLGLQPSDEEIEEMLERNEGMTAGDA
jgi:hypothetical protein